MESNEKKFEVPTWRKNLKRIPNARKDWSQKNPLQKFSYFYDIGRISMSTIWIPTFRDDQTLTWLSFSLPAGFSVCVVLLLYTIYFYTNQGKFQKSLPCTCLVIGPGFSASLLSHYIFIKKRAIFKKIDNHFPPIIDFCFQCDHNFKATTSFAFFSWFRWSIHLSRQTWRHRLPVDMFKKYE